MSTYITWRQFKRAVEDFGARDGDHIDTLRAETTWEDEVAWSLLLSSNDDGTRDLTIHLRKKED